MGEELRSRCHVKVSRDMVQVTSLRDDSGHLLSAHANFDHQAALQLHRSRADMDTKAYGRMLFDLLFMADPKQRTSAVLASCLQDPSTQVQLVLELVDETLADLLELRWEYLRDVDGRDLALDSHVRLVRRLASLPPSRALPLQGPPRLLVVIASPDNLEDLAIQAAAPEGPRVHTFAPIEAPFFPQQTLDLITHFDALKSDGLLADYRVLRGPLPEPHNQHPSLLLGHPTLGRIHEVLQVAEDANQPYHLIHFLAHGHIDRFGGYLLLVDEMGDAALIQQGTFQSLFPRNHHLRLIVLAACQSGSGEQQTGQPLAGLAPAFLRVGLSAVVAMQDKVSVRGAQAFTETFYRELLTHGHTDTAVVEARREVDRCAPSDGEWGVPVLYLQDEESRLLRPLARGKVLREAVANPFYTSGRINDPARFFGRARLIREICSELAKGCSVSIVGESQVGKSSLLYYVYKTSGAWKPDGQVEFIDLQSVLDEADFCETVLRRLGESGDTLRQLKRALANRELVLMFDEVERLAEADFNPRLHDLLRSLAQEPHFAMCLATERPLDEVFPARTPGGVSPFHNIFTVKTLGPFSPTEAREFLLTYLANTGIFFSQHEIERIVAASYGHPARLQAAARLLFEEKTR